MSDATESEGRGEAMRGDGSEGRRVRGELRLVAALAALNVLSYVDRQMIAALAPLLIADLGLSRAQLGLLVGTGFMVVFALATVAMGVAADRFSRPRVLAGGLAAWSAATGLTATAAGFLPLLVWRSLVGVGEATLSPTALAMLADGCRPGRLGFANGVFYAGIPIGFASSFALGAWIAPRWGWRSCFVVLGLAGLVAVALVRRIDDPPRSGADPRAHSARAGLLGVARLLRAQPSLAVLMTGGALLAYTSGSSQHTITWLVEERGFAYTRAAWLSALVVATAGLAGNVGIGALTDRARRFHPALRLLSFAALGALALAAAGGFYAAAPSSPFFFPCWALAQAWLLGWYGPLLAAILEATPSGMRASCAAVALLAINLLGVATGPWLTGLIGDRLDLTRGLLSSLLAGALGLVLVAAVGMWSLRGRARPRSVPPPAR